MSTLHSVTEADLHGKKVLLRAGFDLPLEDGVVTDISRVEAIVPTMKYILSKGGALIIMAHQDRPKGKIVPDMSQRPIVEILEKLLGCSVLFAESCVGSETKKMVDALTPGQVLLLENLRYLPGEEKNDPAFIDEISSYADIYVNDAFSNSHRNHASMVSVAKKLPAYMGLQLAEEVRHLSMVTENPKRPLTLIVSGAKIETKIPVLTYFQKIGDDILLGGAIANTFVAAQGTTIGQSLHEKDFIETAKGLMNTGNDSAVIHAPIDAIVSAEVSETSPISETSIGAVGAEMRILDIGPTTIKQYIDVIKRSSTIVWNGPLGLYEMDRFAKGSIEIAQAVADATKAGAVSIVGGGDTLDFHTRYQLPLSAYTFVSTGGGAMLDFVSGQPLPALEALRW